LTYNPIEVRPKLKSCFPNLSFPSSSQLLFTQQKFGTSVAFFPTQTQPGGDLQPASMIDKANVDNSAIFLLQ